MKFLTYIAIIGDSLFILWIFYNAIDSGFQDAGSPQNIAAVGLVVLLALNLILFLKRKD